MKAHLASLAQAQNFKQKRRGKSLTSDMVGARKVLVYSSNVMDGQTIVNTLSQCRVKSDYV